MVGWIDVVAIVVALGFAAIGIWRGFRREIVVTLAGIVLGVMMGTVWADAWGVSLADRLQADVDTFQGVIRLGSLLFILVLIGYGSGFFLPRRQPLTIVQRLLGGLIGLFNGLLVETFSFQYIQRFFLDDQVDSALQKSFLSSALLTGLPWISLGLVLVVSLTVIVLAMIRLGRYIGRLTQEAPAEAAPAAPAPSLSPAAVEPVPLASPPVPEIVEPVVEPEPVAPEEPTVPCPNCQQPLTFGATYCPHCGKIVS